MQVCAAKANEMCARYVPSQSFFMPENNAFGIFGAQ